MLIEYLISIPIYSSLLKHGYQSFSLTILYFSYVNSLISSPMAASLLAEGSSLPWGREKHFFYEDSPEDNILKTPVVQIEEQYENIKKHAP